MSSWYDKRYKTDEIFRDFVDAVASAMNEFGMTVTDLEEVVKYLEEVERD